MVVLCPATGLRAQTWNDARVRDLVELATQRRVQQLADTGLMDYQAAAHGYLTFLAQVGEGYPDPPKIIKTDELALQVYWRSPGLSKQVIVGHRDTTLLPTDIQYHRDHLGIVQNNFPETIRLGDGDEVRDVPHPLSIRGLATYDFAITDSLRLSIPGRTIDVYEVKVRPKDDQHPAVIGALYIDRDGGQVVRMALSFTRASFLDDNLEDVSIVLENGLFGTRFWLPRRQEIEIRRTGTWLDYPVRAIIRGRWEIGDYHLNLGLLPQSFGPQEIIAAPPAVLRLYPWKGGILDSLPPDVVAVQDADVQRVQDEARALVREQALERGEATRVSAHGVSDFVAVNRVQGLVVGGGLTQRLTGDFLAAGRVQYGLDERMIRGDLSVGWQRGDGLALRAFARHELADALLEPERSGVFNSLAAQEFGSDATEPYDVRAVGLELLLPLAGMRWTFTADAEHESSVEVHASPAQGSYAPTIDVAPITGPRFELRVERPSTTVWLGVRVRASLDGELTVRENSDASCARSANPGLFCPTPQHVPARAAFLAELQRPLGAGQLMSRTAAAITNLGQDFRASQDMVYFGGPMTAPGYDLHAFAGSRGFSERLEWETPVPFFAIPVGRFGTAPRQATLAPFVNLVGIEPLNAGMFTCNGLCSDVQSASRVPRLFPSAGLGFLTFFDILRFDVARGFGSGGRWTFSVDVIRDFWGIL